MSRRRSFLPDCRKIAKQFLTQVSRGRRPFGCNCEQENSITYPPLCLMQAIPYIPKILGLLGWLMVDLLLELNLDL
jgi:hypothetical protein